MIKTKVFSVEGKKSKEMELPKVFSQKVRDDVISKVLEAKKTMQPYGSNPLAGKQHVVNKIVHRRHVWRSGYGRGQSRVPRKILLRRGSQFNWEGAEVPFAKGGRRTHPPKAASKINSFKINKKEMELALISSLSATVNPNKVSKKYGNLEEKDLEGKLPFIVEDKIIKLKTKNLIKALKKILGDEIFEVSVKKRKIRSGIGKMRGRKYKKNAGALLVLGKDEKMKTNVIDVKNANNLSVLDLARGGTGRIVIYTENSIKELGEKFGGKIK